MLNKRQRCAQREEGHSADIISSTHLIIRRDPGAKTQSREPFVTETKSQGIGEKPEILLPDSINSGVKKILTAYPSVHSSKGKMHLGLVCISEMLKA